MKTKLSRTCNVTSQNKQDFKTDLNLQKSRVLKVCLICIGYSNYKK